MVAQAMTTDNQKLAASPFTSETMLPDLLREHPQVRRVFDRYGLKGCGGRLGPVETVEFFARTHGVDEGLLLSQVREAIEHPELVADASEPSVADTIYRRYFMGGIVLILTAGATWGAWLLWKIGFAATFKSTNAVHDVNAHGHAQIYGWVGLFIMGFAYQAFPRIWHTELAAPRLAVGAFVSMVLGLIVRTVGMTLAGSWSWALTAAMVGGALEIAAVVVFAGQIVATFRRGKGKVEPYVAFVVMALFWFVAMSVMDVWHTYTTMTSQGKDLVRYIATYQAPLRDLQIHGLALFMILGVSMRMLPPLFGVAQVPVRRAWWALGVLTAAVIGEFVVFLAYRWTNNHAIAALLMVPWIMLAVGVGMVAWGWKLWRAFPQGDRSGKFVRAAYAWLAISLLMLLALPGYRVISGQEFSHAYYGAIRHAITVGFISLMIMGFAAKVVPTLNGIDTRKLSALWGPFVLVNLGCFLRCSIQTLTDFNHGFFPIIGISGTLEVAGLTWWGLSLARIMLAGKRQEDVERLGPAPLHIAAEHRVTDVLGWFPQTQGVFDRHGFAALRNPVLRRTVARGVIVGQAANFKGVNLDELLRDLNAAIAPESAQLRRNGDALSLPVLIG